MGEPFFGRTAGEDGLVVWFEQVDRNHDGVLTADEMAADADRFFRTLDVNRDGEIDPDEIARYETVIAPEVRTGRSLLADVQPSPDRQQSAHARGHGGGGGHGRGGDGDHRGGMGGSGGGYGEGGGADDEARAGRYGLLEIPEPVASADANFDRGVSAQEFHKAALARFQLLDMHDTGKLTLPDLRTIRSAAASAARRRPSSQNGDMDDNAPPRD
jgi:Ca2+-binding EF-hand superfamily protein